MLSFTGWTGFACIFMRMTGCVLFNPIIGRRNFPASFRAGMVLVFTLLIASCRSPAVPQEARLLPLAVMLLSELFVGFVIGLIVNMFSYVILLAGQLVDLQMGLSMSNIYDPQSNISMSLSATYYNVLFILLFFGVNGHLTMIKLFLTSSEIIPYGQAHISAAVTEPILQIFCDCTELALKLCIPLVAIQFLLEIGVGLLMKAIPQIDVFVINLQLKVLVGLAVMLIAFSPMASFIDRLIVLLLDTIQAALTAL